MTAKMSDFQFRLPSQVAELITVLKQASFEAYVVGGAVRDMLLGRSISDYDIATDALPEEMRDVFRGYRTIETGIKHGTITVICGEYSVEITTYRRDGVYLDNRHPKEVTFSKKIEYDLSRRDFTVNAMAYGGGKILDLFEGIEDLENSLIRCVGDAKKRFCEDGLRIIRALRFASQLDFIIEDKTSSAIHSQYMLLRNISAERISCELKKLIEGRGAARIIEEYKDVFSYIIPNVRFDDIDKLNGDYVTGMVLLLPDNVSDILKRLKLDNKTAANIKALVKYRDLPLCYDRAAVKKVMRELGYDNFKRLAGIWQSKEALIMAEDIVQKNECYLLSQLAINGDDIISLGLANGEKIGKVLEYLLNEVIEGKVENTKEKLMKHIL